MAKANTQVSVTIAAVDALTAPVRRMNQAVSDMLQPIAALQAAVGRLGREVGLERLGRSIQKLGDRLAGVGAANVVEGAFDRFQSMYSSSKNPV